MKVKMEDRRNEFISDTRHYRIVNIHAENCKRNEDGTWAIEFAVRPLSSDENKVLRRLFPNSEQAIELLLEKESLIQSIVSE